MLGLVLTLAVGAVAMLDAALNLDHDFAQDDISEATLLAFFLPIVGTPIVAFATAVVGLLLQPVLRRRPRQTSPDSD
jgi:uncharacterized membrane protein